MPWIEAVSIAACPIFADYGVRNDFILG